MLPDSGPNFDVFEQIGEAGFFDATTVDANRKWRWGGKSWTGYAASPGSSDIQRD
ncbi:hypothetical protein [Variovorax sp. LT1R16]|uniref:hypothetical protein n=1 Tax=Variovorax sp. LT1R16 TaxID=3443728 RepID=UPI003F457D3D